MHIACGNGMIALLLVAAAASSPTSAAFTIGKPVSTTSGIVRGHAAAGRKNVSEYLGIPFAKPPLGSLRFAAPEPYRSDSVLNATQYGKTCLTYRAPINFSVLTADDYHLAPTAERYLDTINEDGLSLGEDCLTLNVWTKPQTGEKVKAVLFYLYGGGFQGGDTASPLATGEVIADEDVVVITANYRANVFGFPGLQPEVSSTAANAGLLDQRLAIEWARDNVVECGGDPSRITLFGQSAGSVSIHMYGYAYVNDLIAHGLIGMSGAADSNGIEPRNTRAAWAYMSGVLGCGNSSTAQNVACVRAKPATEVLAASHQVPSSLQQTTYGIFTPTADNVLVFDNYSARAVARQFAALPRLLGSSSQEGGYFQDFFTLVLFTCPTAIAASQYAATESSILPVWRYLYHGDYPNTQITINPSLGAYHGAELRPLFGVSAVFGIADTQYELATESCCAPPGPPLLKIPCMDSLHRHFDGLFELSATSDSLCPVIMPGFEALGGPNGALKLAKLAALLLEKLEGSNFTQVLDILTQVAKR